MDYLNVKIKEEVREEIPDLSRITCDPCNIAFIAESDYFAHVKETHLKFDRKETVVAPALTPTFAPVLAPMPAVNQLTFQSPNLTYLNNVKLDYGTQTKGTFSPKVFNCPQCKRTFKHEKNLTNHIKSKHENGTQTFKCDECDKVYMQKHNLEEHILVHHRNQRFNCTQCDMVYASKKTLYIHIKAAHQGKSYNCNQCDAKYFYRHELQQHQRSKHQGVVYECNQCNDAFKYKQSLKQHIRNVHEKIKDKKCEMCGMTFALHSGLYMHMKRKHEAEWIAKRAALAAARNAVKEGLPVDVIPRGVHPRVPSVQATSATQNTQIATSTPVDPTSQLSTQPALATLTPVAPTSQWPQTSSMPASTVSTESRPKLTPMSSVLPMAQSPYSMASLTPMVPLAP